ncbi:MAG: TlpA family protein disulfide reductase [Chitinophagaceae bacterium]
MSLILLSQFAHSQDNFTNVKLKSILGKEVNFADIAKNSKDTIVVVSFWATWCIPCITELDNINDEYEEISKKRSFKFIGISIDDSRTANRVRPFVLGRNWQFDVYLDVNSELKRALNITDVPHVLIIKDNKIVYRHTGYIVGEEENLFAVIKSL